MLDFIKPALLFTLLFCGQASLATPREDALFIVQRSSSPAWDDRVDLMLREAFVATYFRPISGQSVEIADFDRFIELIPDQDIAPYVERMNSEMVEVVLSIYRPDQLVRYAAALRADENATLQDIFEAETQRRSAAELERARLNRQRSGSDDPNVIALEELVVELDATTALLQGETGENLAQSMAGSMKTLSMLMGFTREIRQIEQPPNNPVTIAALKADGILSFANPVQRQSLLRQFSTSENSGGSSSILFVRPPTGAAHSN